MLISYTCLFGLLLALQSNQCACAVHCRSFCGTAGVADATSSLHGLLITKRLCCSAGVYSTCKIFSAVVIN